MVNMVVGSESSAIKLRVGGNKVTHKSLGGLGYEESGHTGFQEQLSEEQLKAIESIKDIEAALGNKEDSANKTTELSENSTDEQYPSAKAVVGYVDEKVTLTDEKAQQASDNANSIAERLGGLKFSVAENGILTISKED